MLVQHLLAEKNDVEFEPRKSGDPSPQFFSQNEQAHEAAQRDADLIPECGPYVLPFCGGIPCPGKSVLLETLMIKEVAVSEDGIVIVQISVSSGFDHEMLTKNKKRKIRE